MDRRRPEPRGDSADPARASLSFADPRARIAAALAAAGLALACAAPSSYSVEGGIEQEPLERLRIITAAARSQEPGEPVETRVVSKEEASNVLQEAARNEIGAEAQAAVDEALVALGLWPQQSRASEALATFAGDQVLGFYVPRERALYVIDDAETPTEVRILSAFAGRDLLGELVLSHELAHALQHRAEPALFDRAAFFHAHGDAAAATAAAAEGDAIRASFMALGMQRLPDGDEHVESTVAEIANDDSLADAPALLRLEIILAYGRGYALALREGPPILSDPPISTEQATHDERRREAFTALDFSGIAAPEGCAIAHENAVGELGIRALFEDHGEGVAEAVWEGWDGDRYRTLRCDGVVGFVWITLWDDEDDAAEFESAYAAIAPSVARRAGLADVPRVRREGREVRLSTASLESDARRVSIRARRGRVASIDELFIFYGEPTRPSSGLSPYRERERHERPAREGEIDPHEEADHPEPGLRPLREDQAAENDVHHARERDEATVR